MNCSQFEELLHDLDRPDTDGFAARDAAFAHADSCDRCTQLLTQSEALDFALHSLSERTNREKAPLRIEALLVNELRQRNASPVRRVWGWQIAALGTAAALLLALGFALHYRAGEKRNTSAKSTVTFAPQPATAEHSKNVVPVQSAGILQQQDVADNQADDSLSVTPFIALPYADDGMASEGGTVVRVILSRPALASLGLPVTDIGVGDRIPADIVVSEDGAPQAIRLVAQSDTE
jgi:hypothetical protein